MSEESLPSPSPSRPRKKGKRFLVGAGIAIAALLSIWVLIVSIENWKGAKAWQEVRDTLTEAGIPLDFRMLLPPEPSAEDNFGGDPLLAALVDFTVEGQPDSSEIIYRHPERVERFEAIRLPDSLGQLSPKPYPLWAAARHANLEAVAEAMRKDPVFGLDDTAPADPAAAILAGLHQSFGDEIEQLDRAAQRPQAVLSVPIGDTFLEQVSTLLPHISSLMAFQRMQAIRLVAALETGDTTQARAAFLTMQQVAEMAGSQPLLISHLVRLVCEELLVSACWQGLARGHWSEADLAWLASRLDGRSETILDHLTAALTMEMNCLLIGGCDYLKRGDVESADLIVNLSDGSSPDRGWNTLFRLVPDGVWDHNKALGCRLIYEGGILPAMERNPHAATVDFEEELRNRSPRNFFVGIALPATTSVIERAFKTATSLDLLRTAIALERYYLANNKAYPESLDSLVPAFLVEAPADYYDPNRAPVRYGKVGDRYRIYSVGINGKDDGGTVELKGSEPQNQLGDWTWGYEPVPPPEKESTP